MIEKRGYRNSERCDRCWGSWIFKWPWSILCPYPDSLLSCLALCNSLLSDHLLFLFQLFPNGPHWTQLWLQLDLVTSFCHFHYSTSGAHLTWLYPILISVCSLGVVVWMRSVSHSLGYLNTCFPMGGAVWGWRRFRWCLLTGGSTLLEEGFESCILTLLPVCSLCLLRCTLGILLWLPSLLLATMLLVHGVLLTLLEP